MYPELFNINLKGLLGLNYIPIASYAVCIVLGTLLASLYGKYTLKKELGISISNNFIYLLFLAGYIGGKVFLYLERPQYYITNPNAVLDTYSSGFVFYGSFIFVIPTAIWYFKKHSLPIWPILDVLAISTTLIQIVGRTGCFLAGCCYGKPTEHVFGMAFPVSNNLPVHPTQLYESMLLCIGLVIMLVIKKHKAFNGQLFLIYLSYYGICRIVLEIFRGDVRGQIISGVLSHSQGIAIILIAISLMAYLRLYKQLTINSKNHEKSF
ncbi:prolipoprotein diacylglyceryl transferase [Algibacter mikhailovii]|uniref:Phosphatidylglycerol--prolipoprotein diacylglyceryl transferase n=1 Tax=Algibacter mikhailovii TaxID=425498 RepID=A0A918V874_9FLAO|nr:prolipoprotein diacylglyceryl transferase [Algibacter mikhailovii]GGZ77764.1 prolipoprotein diacylglyceryl transferase [Algibacter mikhailovii]